MKRRRILAFIMMIALLTITVSGFFARETFADEKAADDTGITGGQQFATHTTTEESAEPIRPTDTFKIIEVIPHPICSVFPLLVNWGTKENYDRNVPVLGYQGEWYYAVRKGGDGAGYGITVDMSNATEATELEFYNVEFGQGYSSGWGTGPGIWRTYESRTKEGPSAGYFEYVGAGKGLFKLNLSAPKSEEGNNSGQQGIKYEVRCMDRTGSAKRGDIEVQGRLFYFTDKNKLGSLTSFSYATDSNYNLKFSELTTGTSELGEKYRAYEVTASGTSFNKEYTAALKKNRETDWIYGFTYAKDGNYSLAADLFSKGTVKAELYDSTKTYTSGEYYIRVAKGGEDGIKGLSKGHFELYDKQSLVSGKSELYHITPDLFKTSASGSYILPPDKVKQLIASENSSTSPNYAGAKIIVFTYSADQKGNYSVTFIPYADRVYNNTYDGISYKAEVTAVSYKKGQYKLASAVTNQADFYDMNAGTGDYARILTRFAFSGFDSNANGAETGSDNNSETAWIFHAYTDEDVREETMVGDIPSSLSNCKTKDSGEGPTRLYVGDNQNRSKCRYKYYGLSNNDWLKLLMLEPTDDGENGWAWNLYNGYGGNAQSITERTEVINKLKSLHYDIDISQCLPSELTPQMVADADLIYICDGVGVYNLAAFWNDAIDYRLRQDGNASYRGQRIDSYKIPQYSSVENMLQPLKFASRSDGKGIFSAATVLAIYKHVVFTKDTSLIVAANIANLYDLSSNNTKMMCLFECLDNSQDFAYFIDDPDYQEYKDGFSSDQVPTGLDGFSVINSDLSVTYYKNNGSWGGDICNWGSKMQYIHYNNNNLGRTITPSRATTWADNYFIRYTDVRDDWGTGAWGADGEYYHNIIINSGNTNLLKYHQVGQQPTRAYTPGVTRDYYIGNRNVQEDCTWYIPWDGWNFLEGTSPERTQAVYQILQNRRIANIETAPEITVVNADLEIEDTADGVIRKNYYYYVDAYTTSLDDYKVEYFVKWAPSTVTNRSVIPDLASTSIYEVPTRASYSSATFTYGVNGYSPEYRTAEYYDGGGAVPYDAVQFPNVFLRSGVRSDWDDSTTVKSYILHVEDVAGGYDEAAIFFIIRPEFTLN